MFSIFKRKGSELKIPKELLFKIVKISSWLGGCQAVDACLADMWDWRFEYLSNEIKISFHDSFESCVINFPETSMKTISLSHEYIIREHFSKIKDQIYSCLLEYKNSRKRGKH